MIGISRLALIAVAATAIASPALAQSFDPDVGTGNIVPFRVGPASVATPVQHETVAMHKARHAVAARQSGLGAFAMVPAGAGESSLSPAATGGGSVGYNENLRRDQW